MARPRRKLRWVKFDIDNLLFGTTREELDVAERSIWYDLILLAGQANDDGWIIPPLKALPRILNAPKEVVTRAIERCVEYGKVELGSDRLRVINFTKYNPSRWETAYYKDQAKPTNPGSSVENSTIEQKPLQNVTESEEIRSEKKREESEEIRSESEETPDCSSTPAIWTIALREYEVAFGPIGNSVQRDQWLDLWDDNDSIDLHRDAIKEMELKADRPNLVYFRKVLETIKERDYVEVEE